MVQGSGCEAQEESSQCYRIFVDINELALSRPANIPVFLSCWWESHTKLIRSLVHRQNGIVGYRFVFLARDEMRQCPPLLDPSPNQRLVVDWQDSNADFE